MHPFSTQQHSLPLKFCPLLLPKGARHPLGCMAIMARGWVDRILQFRSKSLLFIAFMVISIKGIIINAALGALAYAITVQCRVIVHKDLNEKTDNLTPSSLNFYTERTSLDVLQKWRKTCHHCCLQFLQTRFYAVSAGYAGDVVNNQRNCACIFINIYTRPLL